jgi:hypothetical protein
LDELTSEQISEWIAYDRLDPIGKNRDEYGWAVLCSVVVNLARDIYSKKGTYPKHTTPEDFLPDWAGERQKVTKKQTVEEQKQILLDLANRKTLER